MHRFIDHDVYLLAEVQSYAADSSVIFLRPAYVNADSAFCLSGVTETHDKDDNNKKIIISL